MTQKSPLDELTDMANASDPEITREEQKKPTLKEILAMMGGPNEEQLTELKQRWGNQIYVLPIDEEHVYVYRALQRLEWIQMKNALAKLGDKMSEDDRKEKIVMTCLIWPVFDPLQVSVINAGLIDTLYEAIMYASYFLPSTFILNLAEKL